jgi:predicted MFS family arabinose efflux permease
MSSVETSIVRRPVAASVTAGRRYYLLAILGLIFLINCVDRQIMAVVMEPMRRELRLTDSQVGLISGAAFAMTLSLLSVPLAQLADRTRRKPVIVWSTLAFSLFTASCGLVSGYWDLLLARLGVAVGEAGTSPQAQALLAEHFAPSDRPWAMAVYSVGANLGWIVAFLAGGLITSAWGWRAAFMAPAAFGLVVTLVFAATVREAPRREKAAPRVQNLVEDAKVLFGGPALRHLTAGLTLATFAAYGGMMWMPTYFVREQGLSSAQMGGLLAVMAGGGGLVGTLMGGFVSTWLGRFDLRWSLWGVAVVLLGAAPMVLVVYGAPTAALATPFVLGPALAAGFVFGPTLAHVQGLTPARLRGTASALVGLVSGVVGAGLGPTSIGFASDAFGRLGFANGLSLALSCTAAIWIWAAIHYALAGRLLNGRATAAQDDKTSGAEKDSDAYRNA